MNVCNSFFMIDPLVWGWLYSTFLHVIRLPTQWADQKPEKKIQMDPNVRDSVPARVNIERRMAVPHIRH